MKFIYTKSNVEYLDTILNTFSSQLHAGVDIASLSPLYEEIQEVFSRVKDRERKAFEARMHELNIKIEAHLHNT
jgi:hypothetical protein